VTPGKCVTWCGSSTGQCRSEQRRVDAWRPSAASSHEHRYRHRPHSERSDRRFTQSLRRPIPPADLHRRRNRVLPGMRTTGNSLCRPVCRQRGGLQGAGNRMVGRRPLEGRRNQAPRVGSTETPAAWNGARTGFSAGGDAVPRLAHPRSYRLGGHCHPGVLSSTWAPNGIETHIGGGLNPHVMPTIRFDVRIQTNVDEIVAQPSAPALRPF